MAREVFGNRAFPWRLFGRPRTPIRLENASNLHYNCTQYILVYNIYNYVIILLHGLQQDACNWPPNCQYYLPFTQSNHTYSIEYLWSNIATYMCTESCSLFKLVCYSWATVSAVHWCMYMVASRSIYSIQQLTDPMRLLSLRSGHSSIKHLLNRAQPQPCRVDITGITDEMHAVHFHCISWL